VQIQLYIKNSFTLSRTTTQTQQTLDELYDPNATFISSGVKAGFSIVVVDDLGGVEEARITAVQSETVLELSNTVYPQSYQYITYTITGGLERVELFKDESVTITDSIQNVKDIEKVFTAFTQSFSVPASKNNNKIFRHYYNFDIIDGFDARKKVKATIELNNLPFRSGKIKLEGVDLKNNKPHTYRITFFGDIVDLKDKLGEKKLSDLDLTAYDLTYDASTIKTKLTTAQSSSNHIIAPLITHSQRLFYDSDQNNEAPDDGNLYWHSGGGNHIHGVKFNELKYAMRVNKIIQAIEADFDLSFSNDFFNNTGIDKMNNLFLWLHRKSGAVEDLSGSTGNYVTQIDGWTSQNDDVFSINNTTFTVNTGNSPAVNFSEFQLDLNTTSGTSYKVEIFKDGTSVYSETGITGNHTVDATTGDFDIEDGDYTVFVTATAAITFSSIVWRATFQEVGDPAITVDYSTTKTTNSTFAFNISQQIPDMKILDFLTGLFKLFNLTAFVENNVIKVQPLDDFYAGTDTYDITEFVDVESSKVDVALPYKEIEFKFKDTKTFLANKFGELNNREWGKLSYNAGEIDLAGKLYKVEVPFGHLLYERLNDLNGGNQTSVQWGYNVDKSQNAYLGSPLLFYPIYINSTSISFVNSVDAENVANGHEEIVSANMPFNSVSNNSATDDFQLNFNRETSEWTQDTSFADTLYSTNYTDYIVSVFNLKQRLTKVKAYLPMRILLNYNLGDRFIIAGSQYKINSVSTNLLTGESNLELINDL
jgi:hypothetical protein